MNKKEIIEKVKRITDPSIFFSEWQLRNNVILKGSSSRNTIISLQIGYRNLNSPYLIVSAVSVVVAVAVDF